MLPPPYTIITLLPPYFLTSAPTSASRPLPYTISV